MEKLASASFRTVPNKPQGAFPLVLIRWKWLSTFVGFLPKHYNPSLIGRETCKLYESKHILQNVRPGLLKTVTQARKLAPMCVV